MSETPEPVADCFPHESIQVALTGLTKLSTEFEQGSAFDRPSF